MLYFLLLYLLLSNISLIFANIILSKRSVHHAHFCSSDTSVSLSPRRYVARTEPTPRQATEQTANTHRQPHRQRHVAGICRCGDRKPHEQRFGHQSAQCPHGAGCRCEHHIGREPYGTAQLDACARHHVHHRRRSPASGHPMSA